MSCKGDALRGVCLPCLPLMHPWLCLRSTFSLILQPGKMDYEDDDYSQYQQYEDELYKDPGSDR
jgi:hypothetical protein